MENDSPQSEHVTSQKPSRPVSSSSSPVPFWILEDEMRSRRLREANIDSVRRSDLKVAMIFWKFIMLAALASLILWVCFFI